jgi:hypothetical protein
LTRNERAKLQDGYSCPIPEEDLARDSMDYSANGDLVVTTGDEMNMRGVSVMA